MAVMLGKANSHAASQHFCFRVLRQARLTCCTQPFVLCMQSSRFVVAKPEAAIRAGKRTGGRSFTTDFKRAVNTDDFKEAFADTG